MHKIAFDINSQKYNLTYKTWSTLNDQKQKLIDRMNAQLQMFESDKKA